MNAPAADVHLADALEDALHAADTARGPDDAARRLRRKDVPRELLGKPSIAGLLRQAAFEWACLVPLWVAMAFAPWWVDLPLMLLVAGRLHALGVILHDATHMPLRRKTAAIRLLEVAVAYPIATTLNAMRYHHLRHHKDSGMASDPYFKAGVDQHRGRWLVQWLRGLLLMPFWTVRAPFGLLASVLPALRPAYARVFLQDRSGASDATLRDSPEVLACARAELGQVLFQAPLIAAFCLWPGLMAWNFAIPATLTGLLASYRVLCEHRYEPTRDRTLETLLATTRDHHLRPWERIFFAPRNIGFHIVHHLHPQVAQEHLPALRDYYRARIPAYPAPHPAPLARTEPAHD
ncbi:MAG: fatty acid desaturase [Deltaproteobacteria bacterium]|nr:fatty acid desaturase [Deltaproteobacteria bacterium]